MLNQNSVHTRLPVVVKSFPALKTPKTPSFPSQAMLRDFQGEVLVVYSRKSVSVFSLNEKPFASVVARFFRVIRKDKEAVFMVGGISVKGGLFRSINRDEAIGKITQTAFDSIGRTA